MRGGHDMKNYFQCSNRQSNTKNVCTEFHEKILNVSQKMRNIHQNGLKHTPKWS